MNEVRSLHRVVKLITPPPPPQYTSQCLLVPAGSTDAQVLAWASECLDPESLAELRRRIADAEALASDQQRQ
jgi:hypothetical protein